MKVLRIRPGRVQSTSHRGGRVSVLIAVIVTLPATFMAGFGVAIFFSPKAQPQTTTVPPTDFDVPLPEGPTIITVTDPGLANAQLARFVVERRGNTITGLPASKKQIAPRSALSLEDLTFFRRELSGVVFPSDSLWQRANRIRNWLASRGYRTAMPGLPTRTH